MNKFSQAPLHIIISFQEGNPSRMRGALQAVTSMVQALQPPVPLGWNLPLAPLTVHEEVRPAGEALGRLIRKRKDQFLPMGYYGARHPFLRETEMEHDLRQILPIPFPGQEKAFPLPLLMPSQLDLCRAESLPVYQRLSLPLLSGPSAPQDKGLSYLTAYRNGRDSSHPAFVFNGGTSCSLGLLKRKLRKIKEPAFLFFNGINRNNRAVMEELLTLLSGRSRQLAGRKIYPLGSGSHLPAERRGHPYLHTLPLRDRSALIETHRHRTQSPAPGPAPGAPKTTAPPPREDNPLAVLDLASPNTPYQKVKTGGAALSRLKDRDLIANMPGRVEHVNHRYSVIFDAGRFSGFRQQQTPDLLLKEARSYVDFDEQHLRFHKVSAFSIEDTHLCGMREILSAPSPLPEGNPGAITVDYLFPEDIEEMLLLTTVKYPEIPPGSRVQAYVPLELPLFQLHRGDQIILHGNTDSSQPYQWPLPLREGIFQFPGNSFAVGKGDQEIYISFPQENQRIIEGLTLRILTGKRGQFFLSLCPDAGFGDIPASEVAGFETHFSMLISPALPPEKRALKLPRTVQQEILPRAVFRHEEDLSAPAG